MKHEEFLIWHFFFPFIFFFFSQTKTQKLSNAKNSHKFNFK